MAQWQQSTAVCGRWMRQAALTQPLLSQLRSLAPIAASTAAHRRPAPRAASNQTLPAQARQLLVPVLRRRSYLAPAVQLQELVRRGGATCVLARRALLAAALQLLQRTAIVAILQLLMLVQLQLRVGGRGQRRAAAVLTTLSWLVTTQHRRPSERLRCALAEEGRGKAARSLLMMTTMTSWVFLLRAAITRLRARLALLLLVLVALQAAISLVEQARRWPQTHSR